MRNKILTRARAGSKHAGAGTARWPIFFAGLVLLLTTSGQVVAERVDWLYQVDVEVEDQSAAARLKAASQGLLEVLSRVTGLASVPRVELVRNALKAPDLYYNRYVYFDDGRSIKLFFESSTILNLVKNADLPVWASNRPVIVGWIVLEDSGVREVLSAGSVRPLVAELVETMERRGVIFKLPIMDLTDQLNADASVVWGRLSTDLDRATRRYRGDIVLTGRIRMQDDEVRSSEWAFWEPGELVSHDLQGSANGASAPVANALVDLLAERYAVLGRDLSRMEVHVRGIANPSAYGGLLTYLGTLEYIDAVDVTGLSAEVMKLRVVTRASVSQLEHLFESDGVLMLDDDALMVPGLSLVWMSREDQ